MGMLKRGTSVLARDFRLCFPFLLHFSGLLDDPTWTEVAVLVQPGVFKAAEEYNFLEA